MVNLVPNSFLPAKKLLFNLRNFSDHYWNIINRSKRRSREEQER